MKNIRQLKENECTGCGSCYDSCAEKAIMMKSDGMGFYYPDINENLCKECGKCLNVCPALQRLTPEVEPMQLYAAYAPEKTCEDSASGGIFPLLAQKVIREGGVVCGCGWNERFQAEHQIIEKEEEIWKLQGLKYVQSDTKHIYETIRNYLKQDKTVLFCGTPCQTAGLLNSTKERKKLITIDFDCMGVSSPCIFEKYKKEILKEKKIKKISFRSKKVSGWFSAMAVDFEDGSVYHRSKDQDILLKSYFERLDIRKCCETCSYRAWKRVSDLTLADFWGIERYDETFANHAGVSAVFVNTEKGKNLFEDVKENLEKIREVPLHYAKQETKLLKNEAIQNPQRERFYELASKNSLQKAYVYASEKKYDVGIMGVWFGCNYGSLMTYYSLYRLIQSFGLSVLMIDKPKLMENDPELGDNHARRFSLHHYRDIAPSMPIWALKDLNKQCDSFVLGSDQVWNYGISSNFGRSFFFDFVEEEKKKIAYAASFGHETFFAPVVEIGTTKGLLERFDGISLREADGVRIVNETFGLKAEQVLDPVFAVHPGIFDEIAAESKRKKEKDYIATYILDPTPEKREAILFASRVLNKKVINMVDGMPWNFERNRDQLGLENVVENLEVQDWIFYLKNSSFVITDSCHGASFAILFQKDFVCFGNQQRGLSRFHSLLDLFQMRDRMLMNPKDLEKRRDLLQHMDYTQSRRILNEERKRSRKWLHDMLFQPKSVDYLTAYEKIDSRITEKPDQTYHVVVPKQEEIKQQVKRVHKPVKNVLHKIKIKISKK